MINFRNFDAAARIEEIYGFNIRQFTVEQPAIQNGTTQRTNAEIVRELSGTPFYLPVTLDGLLLEHCVMSLTAQKIIVETPMVNRRGSVKELISADDYRIMLDGFFYRADGTYPDTEIDALVAIFDKNVSVALRSALSDYFLLAEDKVVIKKLDFPQQKGKVNVKYWKMELVSDSIFELEL